MIKILINSIVALFFIQKIHLYQKFITLFRFVHVVLYCAPPIRDMAARKLKGFPLEVRDAESEDISEMLELFKGPTRDFIRIGPNGYLVSKTLENILSNTYNMPVRPRDIFVVTFPRSGTTWTQELVWLVVNDLDYETAISKPLRQRYAFLDLPMFFTDKIKKRYSEAMGNSEFGVEVVKEMQREPVEILSSTPDPRFIKSHLPLCFLPPTLLDTAKAIYVARDPRDVVVSYYHFIKLFPLNGYIGDFKQFWNLFINDKLILTPFFEHIKEAWALRHHPNMLFLFYEELLKDLPGAIRRVCQFLGKEYKEDQIFELCEHLSIENFKNNKSVNHEELRVFGLLSSEEQFIRKGKAGGWRDYLDAEMKQQMEQWIINNLRDTDLRFPTMGDIKI